jgi:hypothetical protein
MRLIKITGSTASTGKIVLEILKYGVSEFGSYPSLDAADRTVISICHERPALNGRLRITTCVMRHYSSCQGILNPSVRMWFPNHMVFAAAQPAFEAEASFGVRDRLYMFSIPNYVFHINVLVVARLIFRNHVVLCRCCLAISAIEWGAGGAE